MGRRGSSVISGRVSSSWTPARAGRGRTSGVGVCGGGRGGGFSEAPTAGRGRGWIMMVGGTEENFERGREVLGCLAYKLKHIGPVGTGQALKLANQLVQAGQGGGGGGAVEG